MRKITILGSLLLASAALPLHDAAPVPFSTLFREADTVLIGIVESSRLISPSEARLRSTPVEPIEDGSVYPCELTLRVGVPFKAASPVDKTLSPLSIMSYMPSPECSPGYETGEVLLHRPALWLLRAEQ